MLLWLVLFLVEMRSFFSDQLWRRCTNTYTVSNILLYILRKLKITTSERLILYQFKTKQKKWTSQNLFSRKIEQGLFVLIDSPIKYNYSFYVKMISMLVLYDNTHISTYRAFGMTGIQHLWLSEREYMYLTYCPTLSLNKRFSTYSLTVT